MSEDNVIQFVPKANPNREAPLCNAPDVQAVLDEQDEFRRRYLASHPEYLAPDGDFA